MNKAPLKTKSRFSGSRWFKRILLAIALCFVCYLIAGNVLLRTAWLQNILSRKPSLNISWQSGITVFPGHVRLQQFQIAGNQRLAKWDLEAVTVSGWINLLRLPLKDFRASQIKGETIVHRFERIANPSPRIKKPPGWNISLENLELSDVEQLTFDEYLLSGDGKVAGSIQFQVRGEVDLRNAAIQFERSELRQDGEVIGRSLQFTAEGQMAPFKPGAQPVRELFNLTDAHLKMDGQVASLGFLEVFLEKAPWLKLSGGGHLRGDWYLEKGQIGPNSSIQLSDGDLQAQYLETVVIGSAAMQVNASPKGLKIQADLAPFDIVNVEGDSYISGSGFKLTATSENLQLGKPFDDLVANIEIPESKIPDLTIYNGYLPPNAGVAVTQGHGTLAANFHFEAKTHRGFGEVRLNGSSVLATVDQLPMAGSFQLKAKLQATDLLAKRFELAGSELSLQDVYTGNEKTDGKPWEGKVVMEKGTLIWQQPLILNADLRMAMQDSSPIVALMAKRKKVVALGQNILTVKNLSGSGSLTMNQDAVIMNPFQMNGEKLEVMGQLQFGRKVINGKMFIKFRGIKLGIAFEDSKRNIKWTRARKWYAQYPDLQ